MRSLSRILAFSCTVLLAAAPASAVPVLWTLSGVGFDDGGSATGSFVFDADTATASAVAITTTLGTSFAGTSYAHVFADGATAVSASTVSGSPYTDEFVVALNFASALTNAGGVVSINTSSEIECSNASCDSHFTFRTGSSGTVSGTVIPEPASAALMGTGLTALAAARRRRA